jgi:transposase-like protein
MEQPTKTCPKCGSGDYMFRSRKKVEAAKGQPAAVETKYRCKACANE